MNKKIKGKELLAKYWKYEFWFPTDAVGWWMGGWSQLHNIANWCLHLACFWFSTNAVGGWVDEKVYIHIFPYFHISIFSYFHIFLFPYFQISIFPYFPISTFTYFHISMRPSQVHTRVSKAVQYLKELSVCLSVCLFVCLWNSSLLSCLRS